VFETVSSSEGLRLAPSRDDPDPATIADPLSGAGALQTRILKPAVRRSYLAHGRRRGDNRRGSEAFIELEWDDALDLVAAELSRVRTEVGNEAIYAGSYGWASAGRFHHAQSQIHRFIRCFGGYTDSVDSYSYAVGEVLLPHILGEGAEEHYALLPTWQELAESTGLVVAFGGLSLRNTQINSDGVGQHLTRDGQQACVAAGSSSSQYLRSATTPGTSSTPSGSVRDLARMRR
jgi:biotin/methionine sulfoxide reductase